MDGDMRKGFTDYMDRLRDVGIEPDLGLSFVDNDSELYQAVLGSFAENIADKADRIAAFLKNRDQENYVIEVHALKSSAKTIGAAGLSELSLTLESAGKNGDWSTVEAGTPELLKLYRGLLPILSEPARLPEA